MKKLLVAVLALAFIAGIAYAGEGKKANLEPVTTVVEDTGNVVTTTAQGVADTINVPKNNPVTTAVEATGKVAEASVKTVTLQKIDSKSASETK